LARLSALLAIAFVANVFSMRMTPEQMKRAKGATKRTMEELKQQQVPIQLMTTEAEQKQELEETFMSDTDYAIAQEVKKLKPKEFFIYQAGTADGIVVSFDVLQKSRTMEAMVEDMEAQNGQIAIPITTCPIAAIQLVFDALTNNSIDVSNFSLEKLVEIANAFTFFDVPQKLLNSVVVQVKILMESNSEKIVGNEALKILNPDLQKLIMLEPSINCLKNCIIKKYAQDREKVLINNPKGILSVAFSPHSTRIVSGGRGEENNLILWDISNPHNIEQKILVGHPDSVAAVAFNHDGTKIVSGCGHWKNNLILWNISNPHNITQKSLVGHPSAVNSVAFSHDGTKIASGGEGKNNNLILWDISNPDNIVHQTLVGHPNNVHSVAFNHDGTKIVSGCWSDYNNLILWDISDTQNITHQTLVGHPDSVMSVAFSPDGTKIVSGCNGLGEENNLILWDISDLHNITHQTLVSHQWSVFTVIFNHDGTKIVAGGWGGNESNLILWDISDLQNIKYQPLIDKPKNVTAVAFNSDSTKIVFGCLGIKDNLFLLNISDPQNIKSQPLVGHPKSVLAVAFSHDDTKVVSGGSFLILWDISDLQNITHQTLASYPNGVESVAFSPDSTKIVAGVKYSKNNLILWTILTDQENTLLKQLQNYTTNQILLIYQLCLQSLKGQRIALKEGSEEEVIFMTLPQDMQRLLIDLLSINITT
jgi:WD40 repeat protein